MTIEPCGKDLSTAGGSRERSDAIAREVFEREPPLNVAYEFLNIGGRKMSTSKGRGAAAHRIVEVVPPEQLRFLFLRPRPNQVIEFDPEGTDAIPRLFDEFDRFAAATAGRDVRGDLPPGFDRPSSPTRCYGRPQTLTPRPPPSGRPSATWHCSSRARASTSAGESRRRRGVRSRRGWEISRPARRLAPGSKPTPRVRPDRRPPRQCSAAAGVLRRPAPLPGPARRSRGIGYPEFGRRLADADLRHRARRGRSTAARVRGDLPRVPGPPQRAARRLAPRQPRASFVRARLGGLGLDGRRAARTAAGGRLMSVGLPRSARTQTRSARVRSTRARRGDRRPRHRASTSSGGRSRPRSTWGCARRSSGAPRLGRPRKAGEKADPRDVESSSSTPGRSHRRPRLAAPGHRGGLEDLLLRIPNPADPTSRSAARRRTSPFGPGANGVRVMPAAGRASPTGNSARPSTSSTTPAAPRSPAPGSRSTRAPGRRLQRALISWFLDVHTRENGFTEVWPPAVVNAASARGTGQIPDKEDQMYVVTRDELYLVPRPRSRSPTSTATRSSRPAAARPLRGLHAVLPARGRGGRQGHPRHPAGPPVRQGRDGPVRAARRLPGRPRVDDRAGRDPPPAARPGLPGPADGDPRDGLHPGASTTSRSGRRASSAGWRSAPARTSATTRPAGWRSATAPSPAPSRSSSIPSTAPASRSPGSWRRSSRPTSDRTARSRSRRSCRP